MSEIKKGEYVKLNNGKIGKVITIEKGSIMLDIVSNRWVGLCCITKHSKNILDLIEVGDYVNGWKVLSVVPTFDKPDEIGIKLQGVDNLLYDIKIYSIVTKEQFNSVMYKVVE